MQEIEPPSFPEIIESGFWQNPTDGAFIEPFWDLLYSEFSKAVMEGDDKMWVISDKMKVVGRFFPIDDDRNPDKIS